MKYNLDGMVKAIDTKGIGVDRTRKSYECKKGAIRQLIGLYFDELGSTREVVNMMYKEHEEIWNRYLTGTDRANSYMTNLKNGKYRHEKMPARVVIGFAISCGVYQSTISVLSVSEVLSRLYEDDFLTYDQSSLLGRANLSRRDVFSMINVFTDLALELPDNVKLIR